MMFIDCPHCQRAHPAHEGVLDVIDIGGCAAEGDFYEEINYKCCRCGKEFFATVFYETEVKNYIAHK